MSRDPCGRRTPILRNRSDTLTLGLCVAVSLTKSRQRKPRRVNHGTGHEDVVGVAATDLASSEF